MYGREPQMEICADAIVGNGILPHGGAGRSEHLSTKELRYKGTRWNRGKVRMEDQGAGLLTHSRSSMRDSSRCCSTRLTPSVDC